MIKSMTAFARYQAQGDWGNASFEIKTVNHRYLEVNLRLPDMLRDLEMPLRELIRNQLQRGKVDGFLRYNSGDTAEVEISLNQALLTQLISVANQVEKKLGAAQAYSAIELLRWPDVLQVAEQDLASAQQNILNLVKLTLNELNKVREREGAALAALILQRLTEIEQQIALIRPKTQNMVQEQRKKLLEKINQLGIEVEPNRIEQEVVIAAQRMDVTEEIDRLSTHVNEIKRVIKQSGAVGRKLDFLMQELNREANTLGAKATDSTLSQAAVEIKVLIEQMREQIQNLE